MIGSGAFNFVQDIPRRLVGQSPVSAPCWGWMGGIAPGRIVVEVDGAVRGHIDPGEPVPRRLWGLVNLDEGPVAGFSGRVDLPAAAAGHRHRLRLLGGGIGAVAEFTVERITVEAARAPGHLPPPAIAICMATYEPQESAFRRQVDSIRSQDRNDWICIVNDDCSSADTLAMMRRVLDGEPRFVLFQNPENLGFYRNFEVAMARVPPGIRYVSLADQDDRWYPDKLSTLTASIDQGNDLALSDMRIVDDAGSEIASSYWGYRINNVNDLALMLIANTVTGAASMIGPNLLSALLPFPPRVGDAFHDHWIGCAALAGGSIGYIDRPLYDYHQHAGAVIGHCGFGGPSGSGGVPAARLIRYLNPVNIRSLAARLAGASEAVYWHECRRIESICDNLVLRGLAAIDNGALGLFGRGARSSLSLAWMNLLGRNSARRTNNAERRLARAYLVHGLLRRAERRRAGR